MPMFERLRAERAARSCLDDDPTGTAFAEIEWADTRRHLFGKGSTSPSTSTNTTSTIQSSQPPAAFQAALQSTLGQAQQVGQQPLNIYGGPLVAGFTPDQLSAMQTVDQTQGVANPYINAASEFAAASTNPINVPGTYDPNALYNLSQQGLGYTTGAAGTNLSGALTPGLTTANQAAGTNFGAALTPGFSSVNAAVAGGSPTNFSGATVAPYESPYTQQVVAATEAQFANQNAQQQNQLTGEAAAQGALGGNRLGVAEGVMAGQQAVSQAPVIAGLENQGYAQALAEYNQQQGLAASTGLTEAQAQEAATAQQAGLAATTGLSTAQAQEAAAAQQAALQQQTAQQELALYGGQQQMGVGTAEAQAWLNSQAGFQMGNLGNEAQNAALTGASSQLQTGALQQQLAQEQLSIPYENFLQTQAYPFQTTSYEAGLQSELASTAGGTGTGSGTGSTTSPAPSALSQITGLGLTGLAGYGLYNAAFPAAGLDLASSGALAGAGATTAGTAGAAGGAADAAAALGMIGLAARGGRIGNRFDNGGGVSGFDTGGSVDPLYTMEELAAYNSMASAAAQPQAQARGGRTGLDTGGGLSGFNAGTLDPPPDVSITIIPSAPAASSGRGVQIPQPKPTAAPPGVPQDSPAASGMQDVMMMSALEKILGQSGLAGAPAPGSARGGAVPGFQAGGSPLGTEAFAGAATSGGLPPGTQNYFSQINQLPLEKLMEFSARVPPGTPQGAMIQRAIMMKRMQPNAAGATAAPPAAPTAGFGNGQGGLGGVSTQPLMRRGGPVAGFAIGGAAAAAPAATPPPTLSVQPAMKSFTAAGGETVPVLPTAGLAPGSSLNITPTSFYTAPPPSQTPVYPVNYPTLSGGTGGPTFGALTTLGTESPAPAAAAPAAAPAFTPYTIGAGGDFPATMSTPAPAGWTQPAWDAQTVANWQQSYYAQQPSSGHAGGRIRRDFGGRAGFADGGADVTDMVLDDNGNYVSLNSIGDTSAAPSPRYDPDLAFRAPSQYTAPAGLAETPHRASTAGSAGARRPSTPESVSGMSSPAAAPMTATAAPPSGSTAPDATASPQPSTSPSGNARAPAHTAQPPRAGFSSIMDSPYLPLLAAGLGIMGGRSPFASVNIGQGGLEGVKIAEQQAQRFDTKAERQAAIDRAADQLAETAGYHKDEIDARNKEIARQTEADQNRSANEAARLAQEGKYQTGELGLRGAQIANEAKFHEQQLQQGQWQYGPGPSPDDPSKTVPGSWFAPKGGGDPVFHAGVGAPKAGDVRATQNQTRLNQAVDKSGPTIREWDQTAGAGAGGWRDTGIATTAQDRADAQAAAAAGRLAQGEQRLNQRIDASGPTIRQWDTAANNGQGGWTDTGTATTASQRVEAQRQMMERDPARVREATWLMNQKIAPDINTAYDMVRAGVNDGAQWQREVEAAKKTIAGTPQGMSLKPDELEAQARETVVQRTKAQPQRAPAPGTAPDAAPAPPTFGSLQELQSAYAAGKVTRDQAIDTARKNGWAQ